MKSLILKDYCAIRIQLLLMLLAILVFAPFLMLMGCGMYVSEMNLNLAGILINQLTDYVAVFGFSSVLLCAVSSDAGSGWCAYQRTIPLTGAQVVGARLITMLLLIGFPMVLMTGFNLFACLIFGMPWLLMLSCPLCCGCIQVILLAPTLVAAMKIEVRYLSILYFSCELVFAALFFALLWFADTGARAAALLIVFGLSVAAAATLLASFYAGQKAYREDLR